LEASLKGLKVDFIYSDLEHLLSTKSTDIAITSRLSGKIIPAIKQIKDQHIPIYFSSVRPITPEQTDTINTYNIHSNELPLGIDVSFFRPDSGVTAEDFLVQTIALNHGQETLQTVVKALAMCLPERSRMKLEIIGNVPNRDALEKTIARLGIESKIKFVPALHYEQLPAFLQRAKLCLKSNINEDGQEILLAALACRVPVITQSNQSAPKYLYDHNVVLPSSFYDPGKLAESMMQIVKNGELKNHLTDKGFECVMFNSNLGRVHQSIKDDIFETYKKSYSIA